MLKKGLMVVALGSAIGGPYVASEWPKIKSKVFGDGKTAGSLSAYDAKLPTTNSFGAHTSPAHTPAPVVYQHPLAVDPEKVETPLVTMDEAFRFNVTPQWVMSRWPRVTSGLPDAKLHGMRVSLITGLQTDDLAGALTYYFTAGQKVARLTFSGTTGNPRRFVAMAQQRFRFEPFNSQPGVEKYEIRWNGEPHSELLIRHASVVKASMPNARYEIQMSVVDPSVE
jgi:hypothetical protein